LGRRKGRTAPEKKARGTSRKRAGKKEPRKKNLGAGREKDGRRSLLFLNKKKVVVKLKRPFVRKRRGIWADTKGEGGGEKREISNRETQDHRGAVGEGSLTDPKTKNKKRLQKREQCPHVSHIFLRRTKKKARDLGREKTYNN